MKNRRLFPLLLSFALALSAFAPLLAAQAQPAHKTQNVVVVMIDGMRWQDIFRGADPTLIATPGPKWLGDPKDLAARAQARYGQPTQPERRRALMPFLWSTVATQGQLYGNRDLGSDSHVTNPFFFSYPGYAETVTGIADPRVDSNDNVPNPNTTVFAWINRQPGFEGRVAAFGAWGVFNGIFDKDHSGLTVNAGWDPFTTIPPTPELALLNRLKAETTHVWDDEPFDPLAFHTALEYLRARHPRALFIGLGETDDWAHNGAYPAYLDAAHLADGYIRELWDLLQSMPEYRGSTTLIVLPDHGRGNGPQWTTHGQKTPDSQQTWMAFLGPDTPPLGERGQGTSVTESQVAATLAALLGLDYRSFAPKAGVPIPAVLGR
ncbi:MAG: hypothetical protein P4L03_10395 [Terracidiphilus sp.]|nr:hypothetical protein [Terracidiphilus sp.]